METIAIVATVKQNMDVIFSEMRRCIASSLDDSSIDDALMYCLTDDRFLRHSAGLWLTDMFYGDVSEHRPMSKLAMNDAFAIIDELCEKYKDYIEAYPIVSFHTGCNSTQVVIILEDRTE